MTSMPAGPWVLVIGCHRSGTSAVTGALVAMGLHGVVPADRMAQLDSNPEHWESSAAAMFDEDLLLGLDAAWDAPPAVDVELAFSHPDSGGDDIAGIMADAYPSPGPAVWKDPRACLLLPYWRAVLPGPLSAVFVWREPLAVARSLHTRDGIPLADGLALWERYNRSAAIGLQGIDTYIIDYASVIEEPHRSLGDVGAWLGGLEQLVPFMDGWDMGAAVDAVDSGLRHQTAWKNPDDSTLPDDHRGVAEWLVTQAGGHRPLDSEPPAPTTVWPEVVLAGRRERARLVRVINNGRLRRGILPDEFAEMLATVENLLHNREIKLTEARSEASTLQKQLESERSLYQSERVRYEAVQAKLDGVLGSFSWKMTQPLRSVIGKLTR